MNKLWTNIKCTLKHGEKNTDNRNISKYSWRVLYATTWYNKGLVEVATVVMVQQYIKDIQ
jgi:hypothetical protein